MQQLPEPANHPGEFLPSPAARRDKSALPASYTDIGYANAPDPNAEPESGGLIEYWRILRRRKGTLLLIATLGAIAGFLLTLPQTPIYQVRTSLEIVALNQNFLNSKESNPLNEGGNSVDASDIQTQIKILQSDSLIDRVLAKLKGNSAADSTLAPPAGRFGAWRKFLNLPNPEPASARAQSISYAERNYKVRASGLTHIVEVTVDSMNPQIAADFANTLTSEFIDQNLESRWQTTQHTSEWLSRQLDDMRVRLERSEDRLQAYARQAGLLFTGDSKNNVSEAKLMQLQEALSAAQIDRVSKQSRWEMATSSPADALPDILNDSTLRDYQVKLTELKRQIAEIHATYTDASPKAQRVQVQFATLETALSTERADILKGIKNQYDEALRRENLLTADYSAQRATVTGESEKAVQYDVMKHEVESNRQLYDSMLQQLKQATLASALRASNMRVVDPAKIPTLPYKPDIPVSTSLGLLTGVFLGAAFVIMQERADRSIQEPGETQFFLNLPELGVVPAEKAGGRLRIRYTDGNHSPSSQATQNRAATETLAAPTDAPLPSQSSRVELAMWQRKPSVVAESFRAILVSILFSGENGRRPHVMVITSANPSEGKSTVVSNLGIAVAEVNQKVLLIDADLRKPRLHDVFKLNNDKGLSDLLRSKEDVSASLAEAIQQTDVPDLYVLTSGSRTSAATSLLYSSRMPELLEKLRAEFETILIDTPPMLQIPDARVLGRMVDRVILVVRAGKTTRDAAIAARQRFSEDGTPMLGTVLNDWNPRRSPNGYYGYQNGYYGSYQNHYYGPQKAED
ncbi:MAG TPA: polysaccharide biosynthesis tyrosine autokinase [Bryobacteraceae bacterium]|jgi:capsular exopolysaccharide synthesis family protein